MVASKSRFQCKTFTYNLVFLCCCIATFTEVKDLNTSTPASSTVAAAVIWKCVREKLRFNVKVTLRCILRDTQLSLCSDLIQRAGCWQVMKRFLNVLKLNMQISDQKLNHLYQVKILISEFNISMLKSILSVTLVYFLHEKNVEHHFLNHYPSSILADKRVQTCYLQWTKSESVICVTLTMPVE